MHIRPAALQLRALGRPAPKPGLWKGSTVGKTREHGGSTATTMLALALVRASGRIQAAPSRSACAAGEGPSSASTWPSSREPERTGRPRDWGAWTTSRAGSSGGRRDRHALRAADAGRRGGRCPRRQNGILREPLDDSPAIVWLKDLEGRQSASIAISSACLADPRTTFAGGPMKLPTAATVDGRVTRIPSEPLQSPLSLATRCPPTRTGRRCRCCVSSSTEPTASRLRSAVWPRRWPSPRSPRTKRRG